MQAEHARSLGAQTCRPSSHLASRCTCGEYPECGLRCRRTQASLPSRSGIGQAAGVMHRAAYDAMGQLEGAIAKRANAPYDDLTQRSAGRAAYPLDRPAARAPRGGRTRHAPSRVTRRPSQGERIDDLEVYGETLGASSGPLVGCSCKLSIGHLRVGDPAWSDASSARSHGSKIATAWGFGRLSSCTCDFFRLMQLESLLHQFQHPILRQIADGLQGRAQLVCRQHGRRLLGQPRCPVLPGHYLTPDTNWVCTVCCRVVGICERASSTGFSRHGQSRLLPLEPSLFKPAPQGGPTLFRCCSVFA